jgi:hypothetical protein
MGSPRTEVGRADDEDEREVEITKAFYMGKFEVTRDQFRTFVGETGYTTEAEKEGGADAWNVETGKRSGTRATTGRTSGSHDGRSPRCLCDLERRGGVLQVAEPQDGQKVTLPSEVSGSTPVGLGRGHGTRLATTRGSRTIWQCERVSGEGNGIRRSGKANNGHPPQTK